MKSRLVKQKSPWFPFGGQGLFELPPPTWIVDN